MLHVHVLPVCIFSVCCSVLQRGFSCTPRSLALYKILKRRSLPPLVITYLIMFKLLFLTLCIALGAQYAYSCCFALGRKDANSCCFPRQMEGLQRISIAKKINGRGYAISVCILTFIYCFKVYQGFHIMKLFK
jgi:hypothetical protein